MNPHPRCSDSLFYFKQRRENWCVMWERKRGEGRGSFKDRNLTNHNKVQKLSSRFNLTPLWDESTVRHMPQSRNVTHSTGRRVIQASENSLYPNILCSNASSSHEVMSLRVWDKDRNQTPDDGANKDSTEGARWSNCVFPQSRKCSFFPPILHLCHCYLWYWCFSKQIYYKKLS